MGAPAETVLTEASSDNYFAQHERLKRIDVIFNKILNTPRRIYINDIKSLLEKFKTALEKEVALHQIDSDHHLRIVHALEALNDAEVETYLEKLGLFKIELETAKLAQTTNRIVDSLATSLFAGFYLGGMISGVAIIFGAGLCVLGVIPAIMIVYGIIAYACNPGHHRVENVQKQGENLNTFFAANLHTKTKSNVPSIYPWDDLNSLENEMNELSAKK